MKLEKDNNISIMFLKTIHDYIHAVAMKNDLWEVSEILAYINHKIEELKGGEK